MTDSQFKVAPVLDSTDLDVELLSGILKRLRMQIGGASLAEIARVMNANPAANDYGLVCRIIGALTLSGALPAGTNTIGKVAYDTPTTSALTQAEIDTAAAGDTQVVAGTAAQTIRVHGLLLHAQGPVVAKILDGATSKFGQLLLGVGGGLYLPPTPHPLFVITAAAALNLNLSAAVRCGGSVWYTKSA